VPTYIFSVDAQQSSGNIWQNMIVIWKVLQLSCPVPPLEVLIFIQRLMYGRKIFRETDDNEIAGARVESNTFS
jgi:hypothetical protein